MKVWGENDDQLDQELKSGLPFAASWSTLGEEDFQCKGASTFPPAIEELQIRGC